MSTAFHDIPTSHSCSLCARWHVVHTQPFAERRAAEHLGRQGYPVFFPSYRKTVRHARKTTYVLAPVFPNYLFLRLDASHDRWRSINGTRGVIRLLTQRDVPQVLPQGVVEALQAQAGPDGIIDQPSSLRVGQNVRVMEGPFSEFAGRLERMDETGRVCVLLDLLGRSVSVSMHREALDPAM